MSDVLPRHANVVIIGAGAIGCSIAWALARRGVSDIVVLEKSAITHGSTWHAAGLVGQYRNQNDLTRLMQLSVQLYCEMASETQIDWKQVGSLRLASSAERWHELEGSALRAREQDIDFELISAGAARELFPNLNVAGVHGAAFVSGDGYVDPSSLTQEYAKRARSLGVRFVEDCLVNSIERNGDRLTAANTEHGRIETRSLVLAAGVWARQLGRSFDFDIPVCAVEHQYVVTEKSSKIHPDLPALRDPDLGFYVKPDVGALAIGGWEAGSCLASHGNVPFDFGRELYAGDLERLSSILEAAGRRIPLFNELGIRQVINGPIPVTPDGEPILGPMPDIENAYLAVGFTSGIAASGGAGKVMADWIVDGTPPFPLPNLDPNRFHNLSKDDAEIGHRALMAYSSYYAISEPYKLNQTLEVRSSAEQ